MTSPALFGSYWYATLAAALAGLLFTAAHPVFHGLGGKLGTTASGFQRSCRRQWPPFRAVPIPGRCSSPCCTMRSTRAEPSSEATSQLTSQPYFTNSSSRVETNSSSLAASIFTSKPPRKRPQDTHACIHGGVVAVALERDTPEERLRRSHSPVRPRSHRLPRE